MKVMKMNEILVDIRKYELSDRLKKDMISIQALLDELNNAFYEIDILKDEIKELKKTDEERYEDYLSQKIDEMYEERKLNE